MSNRHAAALVAAFLVASLAALPAAAQSGAADEPMRTPDGQPDISGIFTFRTLTPLERPAALAGQERLTLEEAAAFEASERTRLNRDLFDPIAGAPSAGYQPRAEGGVLSYNEFWYERGVELTADKRTSLIVDPPDGRIPYAPGAREARALRRLNLRNGFADHYTDRSLSDRCIMGFNSGPPMTAASYNNNVQILQIPGYVVIFNEMVHNARIIPPRRAAARDAPAVGGRLPRALGRGDARRRDDELPDRDQPARLEPRHRARRALPARRSRHRDVRVHGRGPEQLRASVDDDDAAPEDRRPALRVRLPRGEHRHARHHGRGASQGHAARRRSPVGGHAPGEAGGVAPTEAAARARLGACRSRAEVVSRAAAAAFPGRGRGRSARRTAARG